MTENLNSLAALLGEYGDHIPLDLGPASLAAEEQTGAEIEDMLFELDDLASGLHINPDEPVITQVARLNHYLFEELGFKGDKNDYDDPRNSFLDYVLEWRRGLPILLSVVTIEVARRAGLELDPIGFPGHFMVSPRHADTRFFVDPFHGGRVFTEERLRLQLVSMGVPESEHDACLAPVHGRAVLIRMSHNLRSAWLKRLNVRAAKRCEDRLHLLSQPFQ